VAASVAEPLNTPRSPYLSFLRLPSLFIKLITFVNLVRRGAGRCACAVLRYDASWRVSSPREWEANLEGVAGGKATEREEEQMDDGWLAGCELG
jgi:hypothetical protein